MARYIESIYRTASIRVRAPCRSRRPAAGPEEPLEGGRVHASTLTAVPSVTDYALARRAVLRDFRSGALTRLDVCDAHPELMRAAQNIGVEHQRPVPGVRRVEPPPREVRLRRQAQAGQRPGDQRTPPSWRSWARRATSSPVTTSRSASTASGTTCAASHCTAACTRVDRGAARTSAPSTGSFGYCEQHEMHHISGSGTTVSEPSWSHDAGTT